VIIALWIAYLAVIIWHVPAGRAFLLVPGLFAIVLLSTLARSWGEATHPGTEPMGVFLAAVALFGFPPAILPPPRGPGFLAAALGSLCVQAIWAVYRYPTIARPPDTPPRRLLGDLRWGLAWGIGLAVFFSIYVGVLFILDRIGTNDPSMETRGFQFVITAYFGGGIAGGLIAGLLRPASRWPLGAMAMGILVAFPVYWAVGLILPYIGPSDAPTTLREQLGIGVVCALMVGPPAALSQRSSLDAVAV
jgi:hypothetical protein